jgi:hypothetical protein
MKYLQLSVAEGSTRMCKRSELNTALDKRAELKHST